MNHGNPWRFEPVGDEVKISFDPHLYCPTGNCRKIRLLQAYSDLGSTSTNATRHITNAEQGLKDGPWRDTATIDGWTLDAFGYVFDADDNVIDEGEHDPYQNGNDFNYDRNNRPGAQDGILATASFRDRPMNSTCPSDIIALHTTFEVDAFCSDGDIAGEWLGRLVWTRDWACNGSATIAVVSETLDPPQDSFKNALARWDDLKFFSLPDISGLPQKGATKCTPP